MQILEQDEEWAPTSGVLQERRDAVEESEARLLGIQQSRRRDLGQPVADLGHELRDVRCAAAHRSLQLRGIGGRDVAPHYLNPGPVGGCTAGFVTASRRHTEPLKASTTGKFMRRPGLSDPGLPAHEHESPGALERVLGQTAEFAHLPIAADEDRTHGRQFLRWHFADQASPRARIASTKA